MTGTPAAALREKLASYPPAQRERLTALRDMVLDVAATTAGVGRIEQALKWGQLSYLTPETKSGTTLRIDAHPGGGVALYVNCQTDLIAQFAAHYPDLTYEGTRAVVLDAAEPLPEAALRHVIGLTLTYHARKRTRSADQRPR